MSHIVLVEPDYLLADNYEKILSSMFTVSVVRDAQQAIDVVDGKDVDLIITDSIIASNNGIEILYELRSYADWINLPIIMLSSLPMHDFPIPESSWGDYGIAGFAYKPKTKPSQLLEMAKSTLA